MMRKESARTILGAAAASAAVTAMLLFVFLPSSSIPLDTAAGTDVAALRRDVEELKGELEERLASLDARLGSVPTLDDAGFTNDFATALHARIATLNGLADVNAIRSSTWTRSDLMVRYFTGPRVRRSTAVPDEIEVEVPPQPAPDDAADH
jgi:hypothetical protein